MERNDCDPSGWPEIIGVTIMIVVCWLAILSAVPKTPNTRPRGGAQFGEYVVEQAEIRDEEYRRNRGD